MKTAIQVSNKDWLVSAGIEIIPAEMSHMNKMMRLASKTPLARDSRERIRRIADGRCYVALTDNLLLGYIEFTETSPSRWLMDGLVVVKGFRRLGIGGKLLKTLVDEADAVGAEIRVVTTITDESAQRFLMRHEFTPIKEIKTQDERPAWVFARRDTHPRIDTPQSGKNSD